MTGPVHTRPNLRGNPRREKLCGSLFRKAGMNPWTTQLTPISFLERSSSVFAERTALVYGDSAWTYRQVREDVERWAHAFLAAGIEPGDRIAYMVPNTPVSFYSTFTVPLIDAVLVPINTRLAADEVRYILNHSGAKLLVCDTQYWPDIAAIVPDLETTTTVVLARDELYANQPELPVDPAGVRVVRAPEFLAAGEADGSELDWTVRDENQLLSINYTSGTTGAPKGVEYSYRGAYLNALSQVVHLRFGMDTNLLWTLPMFHCQGWCNSWAVASVGGKQVCLREVRGPEIWRLIDLHGINRLNGAPTVVSTLMNDPAAHRLDYELVIGTAAAPPSPTMFKRIHDMGFTVQHSYGLTETYGNYTYNQWQSPWADLDADARAAKQARQGVGMVTFDPVRVVYREPVDGELVDVPADAQTMGEVVMRGNNVMKGYYKNPEATAKAFAHGWFHSGDLAVMHPDGYIELRDRAKDIIVSGGENISTIEVEQAINAFPGVTDVAVIGVPDEHWGERPKAFVVLEDGVQTTAEEILEHLRGHLARYKNPREIEFVPVLAKSGGGKTQKQALRAKEWAGHEAKIQGGL